MEARLVEFAELLRQNGLRVSTAELTDAARALALVGFQNRNHVRETLRSTLAKREADTAPFDRAFEFFFSGTAEAFARLDASLAARIREAGLLEGDENVMLLYTLEQLVGGFSALGQAVAGGDRARLAQLFRGASLELDWGRLESSLQTGFYSRRLMTGAGGGALRKDLQSLEAELKARGLSARGLEVVAKELSAVLREVEEASRREVDRQRLARQRRASAFSERQFSRLTPEELERAKLAVRRLGEKLKSRLVRRQRRKRKGALSVHRTLRRNLPWGGVPIIPVFRSRRPERPEVFVLCDVSESVRTTSRLMLLLVHTLQSLFVRVRSFVFVSDLGEVTDLFRALDVQEAVDVATSGSTVSLVSNSNYGRALSEFTRRYLPSVTRRTTVLVIGDGRNNANPPNAWALQDIRRKARRVVWICPETPEQWGLGDSEMLTYAPLCNKVVTVQSLEDLERAADALVPAVSH